MGRTCAQCQALRPVNRQVDRETEEESVTPTRRDADAREEGAMADKLATVELSSAQIGQLALVVGDWIGNQNKVFYEGYFEIEELGRLLSESGFRRRLLAHEIPGV